MSVTAKELLIETAHVLKFKANWTQHAIAKDWQSTWVSALDEEACQWCFYGALKKAGDNLGIEIGSSDFDDLRSDAFNLVEEETGGIPLVTFNDAPGRKYSEVKRVLKGAIKRA